MLIMTKVLLIFIFFLRYVVCQTNTCLPSNTPVTIIKKISLEQLNFFYELAKEIQKRHENIRNILIDIGVIDKTPMHEHFSTPRGPDYLIKEQKDTENLHITKFLLDIFHKQKPSESYTYDHPAISTCSRAQTRLLNDFRTCNFSGKDECVYEKGGFCVDKDFFGSAAAFTSYVRIGDINAVMDRQRLQCDLPNPREVSNALQKHLAKPGLVFSDVLAVPNVWTLFWFQLVIHDMMDIKFHGKDKGGSGISDVKPDMSSRVPPSLVTPYTASVEVSCQDPFYKSFNISALSFVKSVSLQSSCSIRQGNPVSQNSAVLDLDPIYECFKDGKTEFLKGPGGTIPLDSDGFAVIDDARSKTHAGLQVVHYALAKLHNIIAAALKATCIGFTDDEIWERARTILIALWQQMTYNEVVPAFVGDRSAALSNLSTSASMLTNVIPQVINEYASACGRQSHEFAPDNLWFVDSNWTIVDNFTMQQSYSNESMAKNFEKMMIGLYAQPWKINGISDSVHNHLFENNGRYGGDLQTLDIQRGRDVGLPSYKEYLIKRFNRCITGYQSFDWIPGTIALAEKLYKTIDHVDLYFGILCEFHRSAPMGNTCIDMTAVQMKLAKDGDPKFFTRILTEEQKRAIESISLADLLCILTSLNLTLESGRFGRADNANPLEQCRCKSLSECGFDISLFCKKGYCAK